jgi:hypothetical protein
VWALNDQPDFPVLSPEQKAAERELLCRSRGRSLVLASDGRSLPVSHEVAIAQKSVA